MPGDQNAKPLLLRPDLSWKNCLYLGKRDSATLVMENAASTPLERFTPPYLSRLYCSNADIITLKGGYILLHQFIYIMILPHTILRLNQINWQ